MTWNEGTGSVSHFESVEQGLYAHLIALVVMDELGEVERVAVLAPST